MNNNVITRFAPSPTGYLHIGNIRAALYSWLYAKKNNGKFFLRIEDTDLLRNNQKYIDYIFYVLEWLGLYWDDKPIYQSNRIDLYKEIILDMLNKNLAYKCYCSEKRLVKIRKYCLLNKLKPRYDNYCRDKNLNFKNKSYVIRFKNPLTGNILFKDLVFNKVKFNNSELNDFIILRSNGLPTYNFCVVIDDYYMNITHVIRGEDHISNTPKQINLIKYLNFYIPNYVHLPIILNEKGKKLSKRNSSSNIKKYLEYGFLPEAILNSLLRLGWSYKNNEIFHIHEMKYLFDLKNIKKSSCILNFKKLIWINKYYISKLSYNKIQLYFKNFLLFNNINISNINNISEIISYICYRSFLLKDISNFCLLFDDNYYLLKKNDLSKFDKDISIKILIFFKKKIFIISMWNIDNINKIIFELFKKFYFLNKNKIYKYLRFFITGKIVTPSISMIIFLLKKNKVIYRINYSIKKLFNN